MGGHFLQTRACRFDRLFFSVSPREASFAFFFDSFALIISFNAFDRVPFLFSGEVDDAVNARDLNGPIHSAVGIQSCKLDRRIADGDEIGSDGDPGRVVMAIK